MTPEGAPRWEIGVSLFLILACLAVLWETRDIRPGTFEPLGSAPVPQATALLIILLSVAVAIGGVRRLRGGDAGAAGPDYVPRPLDAAIVAGMTIVYVALLDARAMDFAPLTALFLFAAIGFLIRFRRTGLIAAALVAVATGWGAAYVFTRVFIVDLPGL